LFIAANGLELQRPVKSLELQKLFRSPRISWMFGKTISNNQFSSESIGCVSFRHLVPEMFLSEQTAVPFGTDNHSHSLLNFAKH
jgi:hypothetical protein